MRFMINIFYDEYMQSIDMTTKDDLEIGFDEFGRIVTEKEQIKKNIAKIYKDKTGWKIKGRKLFEYEGKFLFRPAPLELNSRFTIKTTPQISVLVHEKKGDSAKRVSLEEHNDIIIGRGKESSIVFSNRTTSKKHLRIYMRGNSIMLEDLGSSNGTYLNGKRINITQLKDGDRIYFSVYQLRIIDGLISFFNVGDDMTLNISEYEEEIDFDMTIDAYSFPSVGGSQSKNKITNKLI